MAEELYGICLGLYKEEPDARREIGEGLVFRQCHDSGFKAVPGSNSMVQRQYLLGDDDDDKPFDFRHSVFGNQHCYLYRWDFNCPAFIHVVDYSIVHWDSHLLPYQDRQLLEDLT